jgi:hypothetical protein
MGTIHIESISDPFAAPEIGRAAGTLLGRAESMGLLDQFGTISQLDVPLMESVLLRLGQEDLLRDAAVRGGLEALRADPENLLDLLHRANAVLEESPVPGREWGALRDALGDRLLVELCGISEVSLRRYAAGSRKTPDVVAQRLHALALIVADLRGAYNDYGIRRWFQRPRPQLEGRSPEKFLPRDWNPDSPELFDLRKLARSISSSPAT